MKRKSVRSPDGDEWSVRRRWMDRGQLRTVILGVVAYVLVVIALLVAGVTIGYLLLIFAIMMISSRIRRPWVVEAVNQTHPHQLAAFPVKGWCASGEAIDSLAREIEGSGLPERIPASQP